MLNRPRKSKLESQSSRHRNIWPEHTLWIYREKQGIILGWKTHIVRWHRRESSEVKAGCNYSLWFFANGSKNIQLNNNCLFDKWGWKKSKFTCSIIQPNCSEYGVVTMEFKARETLPLVLEKTNGEAALSFCCCLGFSFPGFWASAALLSFFRCFSSDLRFGIPPEVISKHCCSLPVGWHWT